MYVPYTIFAAQMGMNMSIFLSMGGSCQTLILIKDGISKQDQMDMLIVKLSYTVTS